ncbi:hypothetical protein ACJX0J_026409 [Zea mays]
MPDSEVVKAEISSPLNKRLRSDSSLNPADSANDIMHGKYTTEISGAEAKVNRDEELVGASEENKATLIIDAVSDPHAHIIQDMGMDTNNGPPVAESGSPWVVAPIFVFFSGVLFELMNTGGIIIDNLETGLSKLAFALKMKLFITNVFLYSLKLTGPDMEMDAVCYVAVMLMMYNMFTFSIWLLSCESVGSGT